MKHLLGTPTHTKNMTHADGYAHFNHFFYVQCNVSCCTYFSKIIVIILLDNDTNFAESMVATKETVETIALKRYFNFRNIAE
jgi:hypothetical protein